jgi:pilus assembly protein Flp/PilA
MHFIQLLQNYSGLRNLLQDRSGATAIEYGLIAALIAVAAVATMTTVGTSLSAIFGTVASSL